METVLLRIFKSLCGEDVLFCVVKEPNVAYSSLFDAKKTSLSG